MVCRTNPSVAIRTRGKVVKLGVCRRGECVCIHHTAYRVSDSSRSGHRLSDSRSTETVRFPVGLTIRFSALSEGGIKVFLPVSFADRHPRPTPRPPASSSEEAEDLRDEGSRIHPAGGSYCACPAGTHLTPRTKTEHENRRRLETTCDPTNGLHAPEIRSECPQQSL